jgi:hypothetical protein
MPRAPSRQAAGASRAFIPPWTQAGWAVPLGPDALSAGTLGTPQHRRGGTGFRRCICELCAHFSISMFSRCAFRKIEPDDRERSLSRPRDRESRSIELVIRSHGSERWRCIACAVGASINNSARSCASGRRWPSAFHRRARSALAPARRYAAYRLRASASRPRRGTPDP